MSNQLPQLAHDPGHNQSGFLGWIEKTGNRLPHPFWLFTILSLIVIVASCLLNSLGVEMKHPDPDEGMIQVKSLVSDEGIRWLAKGMIDNFVGFAPLGLVTVLMFGIGLAQEVGFIQSCLRLFIMKMPGRLLTYSTVFAGIIGNLASDAAFIIIPPLAAMMFYAVGRHPLAGLAAGFAGVGSGFTANLLITPTDVLLSGIATEVASSVYKTADVTPVDNYFFMIASVPVLTLVGGLVTDKIVERRLGVYKQEVDVDIHELKPEEKKGLRAAGWTILIYGVLLAFTVVPEGAPLRNPETDGIVPSPFLDAIVPFTLFLFIFGAVAYGIPAGKIKNAGDIPERMANAMKDLAHYFVLIFAASQFVAYFEWSNLGLWLARSGADFIQWLGLGSIPALIGFILLQAFLNLFIFSGSAQWALMAPIFIPMLMVANQYDPALIQVAYRIADSSTNTITPLNPYIPLILTFMAKYDKRAGFGTLFSMMLPFALAFLGVWTAMLILWILLGLPLGPGVELFLN
ncbi:AbgT family transporter [Salinithrix halophila]|uniref:AbgT family transporter n=1 Tax=Salinithrix halophila TaxID=1485204 RepID=A0ABV8JCP8_9BACL